MPRVRKKPSEEELAKRKAYARQRYQNNKQYFIDKRKEQSKREQADRLLAAQGDTEAAARRRKLLDGKNVSNWKSGRHLPKEEHKAITAALAYVLGPERVALENAANRRKYQQIKAAVEAGEPDAVAKRIAYNIQNKEKQQRWLAKQKQKAAAGDEEAKHRLWKTSGAGHKWIADQLAQGLGTDAKDRNFPLPEKEVKGPKPVKPKFTPKEDTYYALIKKRAAMGFPEDIHYLWRSTKEGKAWSKAQREAGLPTTLAQKQLQEQQAQTALVATKEPPQVPHPEAPPRKGFFARLFS